MIRRWTILMLVAFALFVQGVANAHIGHGHGGGEGFDHVHVSRLCENGAASHKQGPISPGYAKHHCAFCLANLAIVGIGFSSSRPFKAPNAVESRRFDNSARVALRRGSRPPSHAPPFVE
ncbi:MAG TPA: hypothetical protein VIG55_06805 [Methylosinus sp.]